jgi:import inner membrane translocase subunit TIM22
MVTVGGGAMGMVMALFMNAMEFRELDFTKGAKQTTKGNLKKDINKMTSMAKGFAIFGFFFSIWECQCEKMRMKDDSINSFYAGALTSSILAIGSGVGKKAMISTFGAGGCFGIVMYKMNYLFTGHS